MNGDVDLAAVFAALREAEETSSWLESLDARGDPPVEFVLPPRSDLPELLSELGVTDEDAADLIDSLAVLDGSPELWRLVERSAWWIVSGMGEVTDWPMMPRWPVALASAAVVGRAFYAWDFLAALPFSRRFHADRGIPPEISRATFADLGRSLRHGRRQVDSLAVADPWWLERHLRGALYELGRLQF
jgi:hypothetical protein